MMYQQCCQLLVANIYLSELSPFSYMDSGGEWLCWLSSPGNKKYFWEINIFAKTAEFICVQNLLIWSVNEKILKNVINILAQFSISAALASQPSLLCCQLISDSGGEWLCRLFSLLRLVNQVLVQNNQDLGLETKKGQHTSYIYCTDRRLCCQRWFSKQYLGFLNEYFVYK